MLDHFDDNPHWELGQKVNVLDGPFKECTGVIDQIDQHRRRVRVKVNFFWRETPVEFTYDQIQLVDDRP